MSDFNAYEETLGDSKVIPEGRLWKFQVIDIDDLCGREFGKILAKQRKLGVNPKKLKGKEKDMFDELGYIDLKTESQFLAFVSELFAKMRGAAAKRVKKNAKSKYAELLAFEESFNNGLPLKRSQVVRCWRLLEDLMTELGINDAEIQQHDVNTLFARG